MKVFNAVLVTVLVFMMATCLTEEERCRDCPGVIVDTVRVITTDTVFVDRVDTLIKIDTLRIVERDTVVLTETDTLIKTVRDTLFFHPVDSLLRNFGYMMVEDSLPGFRIRMQGRSEAERVRYASKCVGSDSAGMAIDERKSFIMEPDSSGNFRGITDRYYCDELLTYELTAWKDSTEVMSKYFIDVAVILAMED